jgi:hypothetical protein
LINKQLTSTSLDLKTYIQCAISLKNGIICSQEVHQQLENSVDVSGKRPDAASSNSSRASQNIELDMPKCTSPKTKDVKGTALVSRKRKVN